MTEVANTDVVIDVSAETSCVDSQVAEENISISSSEKSNTNSSEQDKNNVPFVYPAYRPSFEAIEGVFYDFTDGVRVLLTDAKDRKLHLVILDLDSDNILYDGKLEEGTSVNCSKKYYIHYRLIIGDEITHDTLWTHDMDLHGKPVLLQMPYIGAVGDSIAWFSVIDRFRVQHDAEVHLVMPDRIRVLVEKQYPDIIFETPETAAKLRPYAAYYIGLFFKGDEDWQPYDFRLLSLSETIGRLLGIDDLSEIPPKVDLTGERTIKEPYVVIATQASSHAKHWCNPSGWRQVVEYLKNKGYRVLCIDKDKEVGDRDVWHHIPYGSEDFTGELPLQDRITLIHHADFFIGLSSGLSWLAWCCKVPIVLISGICMPFGEFYTPYRVQARHTCHGCWNDTRYEFDHKDFMWCPRHKGTPRAYECTKSITAGMVIRTIERIPGTLCTKTTDGESGK